MPLHCYRQTFTSYMYKYNNAIQLISNISFGNTKGAINNYVHQDGCKIFSVLPMACQRSQQLLNKSYLSSPTRYLLHCSH